MYTSAHTFLARGNYYIKNNLSNRIKLTRLKFPTAVV